jgi:hypothetical protein
MNVSMILSVMTHLFVAMRSVLILAIVLLMLIVRPKATEAFALANQGTEAMLTLMAVNLVRTIFCNSF